MQNTKTGTPSSTAHLVSIYLHALFLCVLSQTHTHLCVLHRTETPNLTGVISIEACNQGISIVNSVNMNRLVLKK